METFSGTKSKRAWQDVGENGVVGNAGVKDPPFEAFATASIGVAPTAYYLAGQAYGGGVAFVALRARLRMGNKARGWQAQLH
ncbi:hypothetical protein MRX96_003009 [Rhipicephalus microplus]